MSKCHSCEVGKNLIGLLHDITHLSNGYNVRFYEDFTGMMRVEIFKEDDPDYYEHSHLGFPDCPREKLEEKVLEYLQEFYDEAKL